VGVAELQREVSLEHRLMRGVIGDKYRKIDERWLFSRNRRRGER